MFAEAFRGLLKAYNRSWSHGSESTKVVCEGIWIRMIFIENSIWIKDSIKRLDFSSLWTQPVPIEISMMLSRGIRASSGAVEAALLSS